MSEINIPEEQSLLPSNHAEERPLFVILAVMAFLSALTLLTVLTGFQINQAWQSQLEQTATLEIYPENAHSISELNEKVLSLMKHAAPAAKLTIVTKEESETLLKPWLGSIDLPDDLPLPLLYRVTHNGDAINSEDVNAALAQSGIDGRIDTHKRWNGRIQTGWFWLRTGMVGVLGLILGATIIITHFATRSVLHIRKPIMDVLSHVGAKDSFVIRLFAERFFWIGLKASIVGILLAVLLSCLFVLILTDIRFFTEDIIWLMILILVFALMTGFTAGITTHHHLKQDDFKA